LNIDFENIRVADLETQKKFEQRCRSGLRVLTAVVLDDKYILSPIHAKSWVEFRSKWLRRSKRINFSNLIIKSSEKDNLTHEDILRINRTHSDARFINYTRPDHDDMNHNKITIYGNHLWYSIRQKDEWNQVSDEFIDDGYISNFIFNKR